MSRQYFECFKVFLILIVVFYIPGLLYYPFFIDAYYEYYNYTGGLYLNAFFLIISFVVMTYLSFLFLDKFPFIKTRSINSNFIFFILILLVVTFLILSVNFSLYYSSSFRHNNRLANSYLVAFMFFLKPIIFYILSLVLIYVLNGNSIGRKTKLLVLLIFISSILSLNSSLQFIVIPLILLMLYSPSLLTTPLKQLRRSTIFIALLIFPILGGVIIFIGIGNKIGYEYLLTDEGVSYVLSYGDRLFPRMSSSLFSSVIIFNNILDGVNYSDRVIGAINATAINRLSLLTPFGGFDSTILDTVDRLNYLEVFHRHAPRAGASPGLISSIFYTPFFPFTIFLIPLYVAIVFRSVRYHMAMNIKFNLFSYVFLFYLLINLFEAPLNLLYVLDPQFILFFTVVVLGRFINIKKIFSR